jgi:hypothetical protein
VKQVAKEENMTQEYDIKGMITEIKALHRHAEALKGFSGGIPAVDKNADRILANLKMLEIEISDAGGALKV